MFAVWLAQGLHEWHHLAKSVVERAYHPGTISAVAFVGVMHGLFFPRWHAWVMPEATMTWWAWYALQPIVFAAFVIEHRAWFPRWQAFLAQGPRQPRTPAARAA